MPLKKLCRTLLAAVTKTVIAVKIADLFRENSKHTR